MHKHSARNKREPSEREEREMMGVGVWAECEEGK